MEIRSALLAMACAGALCCASGGSAAQPARRTSVAAPTTFADALRTALPAVLGVYGMGPGAPTRGRSAIAPAGLVDDDALMSAQVGGGFMIDGTGLAVTAAHVVTGCERIVVQLPDGRVVEAEAIAADNETDIALIRLPLAPGVLPVFGNPASLRAGDWVLAVGEPYGMSRSVSAGVVGGMNRHFAEDEDVLFYIQSDVALNPGNSGGPLLDARGAIVGMNVRTVVGMPGTPGVSLAIPIDLVLQVAWELKRGAIRRPPWGASFHDLSAPAAHLHGRSHVHGALIAHVRTGSLAARMGVLAGDIVVGMNGRAVGNGADLVRVLLTWREPGSARVTVFRDGGWRELRLREP